MRRLLAVFCFLLLPVLARAQNPPTPSFGLDFSANNTLAVSAAGHLRLRYNSGTGQLEESIAGAAYTTLAGGSLQQAYTAGGAGGGVIGLTAAGGGLQLKDNVVPLGTNLFSVTDSVGTTTYFGITAAAAGAAALDFNDGASAAVSAVGFGRLIYNNTLHVFQASTNGGAFATLGANGVLGAYQGATSTAQNIIGLTTTLGPVLIRNNAVPIATTLFGVQTSDGTTKKYIDVTPAVLGLTTDNNGGGTPSFLTLDNANGVTLSFGASLTLNGFTPSLVANVVNGTYNSNRSLAQGNTTTGCVHDFLASAGNLYVGCLSGTAGIMGYAEDLVADTGGTTANLVVVWSSADKVQLPAATANLHTVAGVALTTTASTATAQIQRMGRVKVGCDGTVNVGDLVVTSGTTAGRVITNNTPSAGTIVGTATETCAANSTIIDLHVQ